MPCQNLQNLLKHYQPQSTCLIGLGNMDRGDDACGILLCKALKPMAPDFIFQEQEKEVESLILTCLQQTDIQLILFIDALHFYAAPGTIKLFFYEDLRKLLLPVSTHHAPITILADIIKQNHKQFALVGIQPKSSSLFNALTPEIASAKKQLIRLFSSHFQKVSA